MAGVRHLGLGAICINRSRGVWTHAVIQPILMYERRSGPNPLPRATTHIVTHFPPNRHSSYRTSVIQTCLASVLRSETDKNGWAAGIKRVSNSSSPTGFELPRTWEKDRTNDSINLVEDQKSVSFNTLRWFFANDTTKSTVPNNGTANSFIFGIDLSHHVKSQGFHHSP